MCSKCSYDKGYGDGRREADYQKSSNAIDQTIRSIGYSPRESSNPSYNSGFDRGVSDGWSSNSGSSGGGSGK